MNYIENLKAAIAAVEAQPELDLLAYRTQREGCGTLYCVAGLLPSTEHFIKLGVTARHNGSPELPDMTLDDTLNTLFGTYSGSPAYYVLCSTSGAGDWDEELLEGRGLTDKELALARLRKALEIQLDREADAETLAELAKETK